MSKIPEHRIVVPRAKPIRKGDTVQKPGASTSMTVLSVGAVKCPACHGVGKIDYRVKLTGTHTPFYKTTWTKLVRECYSIIRRKA